MIDTDKMRAAFAATPLCQSAWTKKDGDSPTMLCAISALVSFAGVQPDLIHKMANTEIHSVWIQAATGVAVIPRWVSYFALPVLRAEYGVPHDVGASFPSIFDKQENEWRGVEEVLAMCERHNMDELHEQAIHEDGFLFGFPMVAQPYGVMSYGSGMVITTFDSFAPISMFDAPKKAKHGKTRKNAPTGSKFWTAPTTPAIAKKHTGKLVVA